MTRSGLSMLARFAIIAALAWLCSLPIALGSLILIMSTGLQASIFGEHFLFELIAINTATTLCLMFSDQIVGLWKAHQDQILIDAASALMIWLLIEAVWLGFSPAFQSNDTNGFGHPHWLTLMLAVTMVAAVRFRKSIATRARQASGLQLTRVRAGSAEGAQIGAVGPR